MRHLWGVNIVLPISTSSSTQSLKHPGSILTHTIHSYIHTRIAACTHSLTSLHSLTYTFSSAHAHGSRPPTRFRWIHQAVVDPTVLEDKAMCKVRGGGDDFQPCSHMPSRSPLTVTHSPLTLTYPHTRPPLSHSDTPTRPPPPRPSHLLPHSVSRSGTRRRY